MRNFAPPNDPEPAKESWQKVDGEEPKSLEISSGALFKTFGLGTLFSGEPLGDWSVKAGELNPREQQMLDKTFAFSLPRVRMRSSKSRSSSGDWTPLF